MNPAYRKAMLESEIQKLLMEALQQLRDPRLKKDFVTFSRVELSKDKRYADVYVSFLGTPEERKETVEILNRAKGFFRTFIAKNLRLYVAPEIRFYEDKGIEASVKVHQLLVQLGYDPLKDKEKKEEEKKEE
ncbi:30S ribosome-binding factor RbfA [Thermotoga sp. RQ2]|uniref:Ribosome-binding factor A n=1 Tax=Thermotoga sp. (strain RQ2) TaxID=126740 RepID=RBFA_THESQ|nr:30S ribosome-binding factor RbfA [Thermotoga sp. RQ2]B1LCH6.1 RecName: Full=Ribosome-binding factor A [Thermotoga sp. RQ2]ACB08434.1 ribosome-binding factor A [Thermotoga sp. RQ2]